jgi:hypothetical protein
MNYRLLFLSLTLLSACTPSYWMARATHDSLAQDTAPSEYRTIAILPIRVAELHVRGMTRTKVGADTVSATQRRTQRHCQKLAYLLQQSLYEQLRAQQLGHVTTVWLQPARETNLRLARAGITYQTLPHQSMAQLQQALGTRHILTGQTTLFKLPIPTTLLVNALLPSKLGAVPSTLAKMQLTLQDCQSEQRVWQFDTEASETGLLDASTFSNKLVQSALTTFPY